MSTDLATVRLQATTLGDLLIDWPRMPSLTAWRSSSLTSAAPSAELRAGRNSQGIEPAGPG